MYIQFAKKIMILIAWPGFLNFSIGIVNSVLSLPDWKVKFWREFKFAEEL